jgi:hypothetical protein
MKRLFLVTLSTLVLSSASAPLFAEDSSAVFGCNYTLSVDINGRAFSVSHQNRVKDGGVIVFNLQNYLLELRINEGDSQSAIVELVLSEETADGWHRIYTDPLSFRVHLGLPAKFEHNDDIAKLDVDLIVSKLAP